MKADYLETVMSRFLENAQWVMSFEWALDKETDFGRVAITNH